MKIPTQYQQKAFYAIFNKPVNYFYDIAGFDVIKFDKWLKVPKNKSTEEVVLKTYGQGAVDLVKQLLGEL